MGSKFEVGEYKLNHKSCHHKRSNICITKRTPKYIHLHIKEYHGLWYSIYDGKVRKKIFIDDNNNEYIKDIYYRCWSIFTPSQRVLNMDYGFDCLQLNSIDLEKTILRDEYCEV